MGLNGAYAKASYLTNGIDIEGNIIDVVISEKMHQKLKSNSFYLLKDARYEVSNTQEATKISVFINQATKVCRSSI